MVVTLSNCVFCRRKDGRLECTYRTGVPEWRYARPVMLGLSSQPSTLSFLHVHTLFPSHTLSPCYIRSLPLLHLPLFSFLTSSLLHTLSLSFSLTFLYSLSLSSSLLHTPLSFCLLHSLPLVVCSTFIVLTLSYTMTAYDVVRLSASLCHFWQCLWDLGSALAERRDRGRWVGVPKDANSMAVSNVQCECCVVSVVCCECVSQCVL